MAGRSPRFAASAMTVPPAPTTAAAPLVVGLSGGVDSAVAALRLQRLGHPLTAVFMRNWDDEADSGECSAAQDLADAERVCERLDIPLETVNFTEDYWREVFVRFLDEHRAGRTPNPDVLCNREIKFRVFVEHAGRLGAAAVATGHYAGIGAADGLHTLRMAADAAKDQTYFLYTLGQAELARACFPLADLDKGEVRALAHAASLPVAQKKDSTGICFIGERPFRAFLAEYLPDTPGEIVDAQGRVLGEHRGLHYYTLGQRQGLGIGGGLGEGGAPWFVAAKETATNRLVAVQGHDHPLLYADWLQAVEPSWVAGEAPSGPFDCLARTRHRAALEPCRVIAGDETVEVRFGRQQRALTPGQSVVFYQPPVCLGGAVIDRVGEAVA